MSAAKTATANDRTSNLVLIRSAPSNHFKKSTWTRMIARAFKHGNISTHRVSTGMLPPTLCATRADTDSLPPSARVAVAIYPPAARCPDLSVPFVESGADVLRAPFVRFFVVRSSAGTLVFPRTRALGFPFLQRRASCSLLLRRGSSAYRGIDDQLPPRLHEDGRGTASIAYTIVPLCRAARRQLCRGVVDPSIQ